MAVTQRRLAVLLFLTLLIGGCWDQVEIKDRATIIGIGIDQMQDLEPVLLTMQIVSPRGASSNGGSGVTGTQNSSSTENATVTVTTSQGKSFYDAIRNFSMYSPHRAAFFHNRVIIFGKELSVKGVGGVLDDVARDYQFRSTDWVLTAENTAREVMEAKTVLSTYPARDIGRIMNEFTRNAFLSPVNRGEFIYQLRNEGHAAWTPLVQIEPSNTNPTPRIKIEKIAVYKDNHRIGDLNPDEAKGLLWFHDGVKGDLLTLPLQTGARRGVVSLMVREGKTRIIPGIHGKEITMEISCQGEGTLREVENLRVTPEMIARLEHLADMRLRQKVEGTIRKAQEMKADILGFGRRVHAIDPQAWQQARAEWTDIFPRIKTKVRFKIEITQFGIVRDSIEIIK